MLKAELRRQGERLVLKMVDIEFIRKKHFVDGWPIRRISRQLGISRQAVRKALSISDVPRYHLAKPRALPGHGPFPPTHHHLAHQ